MRPNICRCTEVNYRRRLAISLPLHSVFFLDLLGEVTIWGKGDTNTEINPTSGGCKHEHHKPHLKATARVRMSTACQALVTSLTNSLWRDKEVSDSSGEHS